MSWYTISNIASIDSPSLLVYKQRVQQNIAHAVNMLGNATRLRPHVKTNKMAEVCRMMMDAGIHKFKCATIAEAEMLAMIGAKDVLLAYQPVGPKINRFIALIKKYPSTVFSCLVDNSGHADTINHAFGNAGIVATLFIDLNTGMNRTGIHPAKAYDLFTHCLSLSNLQIVGLQGYDGHVRDTNPAEKYPALVVVNTVHLPATLAKPGANLRSYQPRRACYQYIFQSYFMLNAKVGNLMQRV